MLLRTFPFFWSVSLSSFLFFFCFLFSSSSLSEGEIPPSFRSAWRERLREKGENAASKLKNNKMGVVHLFFRVFLVSLDFSFLFLSS